MQIRVILGVLWAVSGAAWANEEKPAVVVARKIEAGELAEKLTYPARVTSLINTQLFSENAGVVTRILKPLGSRVRKGEKILVIEHTDPVYQYAPFSVVSTVAGVVSSLEVTEGTQVTQAQKLGSVTDPAKIKLIAEIPAQDVAKIRAGARGEFSIAGGTPAPVQILGISPYVDPASGTATCEIRPLANGLPPGVVGQVSFRVNIRQAISIPDQALTYKLNEPFVRVLENGKARRVAVKLGARQAGNVEIVDGLRAGMTFIERANRSVADGEIVTVESGDSGGITQ